MESNPLGRGVRERQSLKEILGSGQAELGSETSSHAQLWCRTLFSQGKVLERETAKTSGYLQKSWNKTGHPLGLEMHPTPCVQEPACQMVQMEANHQLEWPRGEENLREANQSDSWETGADPNPQTARILKREAFYQSKFSNDLRKKKSMSLWGRHSNRAPKRLMESQSTNKIINIRTNTISHILNSEIDLQAGGKSRNLAGALDLSPA